MADQVNPPSPEDVIARALHDAPSPACLACTEETQRVLEALDAAGLRISPKLEDGWREVKLDHRESTSNGRGEFVRLFEIVDERGEDRA